MSGKTTKLYFSAPYGVHGSKTYSMFASATKNLVREVVLNTAKGMVLVKFNAKG
jgi:hypothetical protein